MSRAIHPEKQHHRVADLIRDYRIADREEHRGLSDALQEHELYQAMLNELNAER